MVLSFDYVDRNNITYQKKKPKFKKGDPVHVVYNSRSYRAVIISGVIINKDPNDSKKVKIRYDYNYAFNMDDGSAYEENLHLRNKNDYRTHIEIYVEEETHDLDITKLKEINNKEECSICLHYQDSKGDTKKYALDCGNGKHYFHFECLKLACHTKSECPLCRQCIPDSKFNSKSEYKKVSQVIDPYSDDDWLFED